MMQMIGGENMHVCNHRRMSCLTSSLSWHVEGRGSEMQESRRKNEGHAQRQRGMYGKTDIQILFCT